MSRASFSPSKTGRRGGSSLFSFQGCFETMFNKPLPHFSIRVAVQRYASATCCSVQFVPSASSANKILACLILYASVRPLLPSPLTGLFLRAKFDNIFFVHHDLH
jgi:hypothetical protein